MRAIILRTWIGVMVTASAAAGFGDEAQGPHDVVRASANTLMEVVKEGRAYFETDPERFYREVHDALAPVVDFERIAKGVMGRAYFRAATPEQVERFAEVFRWGLVRTYAGALIGFGEDRMEVVPDNRPLEYPNRARVNMNIRSDNTKVYQVTYSMVRNDAGHWRVGNLFVEGVSSGKAYREQFDKAMMELKDLDKAIDTWPERISNTKFGADKDVEAQ